MRITKFESRPEKPGHPAKRRMLYLSSVVEKETTYALVPEHDFLGLVFCLQGNVRYTVNDVAGILQKGYCNIVYLPMGSCSVVLEKGRHASFCIQTDAGYLKQLSPGIPPLEEFLSKAGQGQAAWMCGHHALTAPRVLEGIYSVIGNDFKGELLNLYLNCKFVDLVISSLNHCCSFNAGLCEDDVRKIREAKEYIQQNLKFPLGARYLAEKISLSRRKFESGFKQLYGASVFDFITSERMTQARVMLRDTTLSISDISVLLGYTRLNNFYKTFKRRFGCSPSDLRKKDEDEDLLH